MDEQDEITKEFLVESNENLVQLDQDFVELEQRPGDQGLLSSIFRTIHTIKGTCGFLGFTTLESVTHRAENILSQLRDGERPLTPELTTLLLETVDAVKRILGEIESRGAEGEDVYDELRERLRAVCETETTVEAGAAADGESAAPSEADAAEEAAPEPVAAEAAETENRAAPEPSAPAAEDEHSPRGSIADANIRVGVGLLDNLMNLVGELVLARNQILQFTDTLDDAAFAATSQRLNLITTELQANVMKTRMQPIRVVWNKFPRVVRDMGLSFGKEIDLRMEGADTELDKTIVEAIKDPLTHIVRNSCDHGLETPAERVAGGKSARGRLLLRAYHEGGQVNIEISDDGRGIDPRKLKVKALQKGLIASDQAERMNDRELLDLIFAAGFSTAEKVTNVSGRGVGMDVVRTNIEKIGGSIDLQSAFGKGTTIKIKIPLTLAIIPALVVECAGERFAIPQVNLVELVRVEADQAARIEEIRGAPVYRLRGKLLPLVYLHEVLGLAARRREDRSVNIVVVQADERTFGLVVDEVNDTAEIVVKPLGKLLKGLACYAGATIMGDGRVALILDVLGLAQMGRAIGETRAAAQEPPETRAEEGAERRAVLLFRAGAKERLAAPLALVDRLEEFPLERVETSGDRRVAQYRGKILPLVSLAEHLGLEPSASAASDKLQAVVFSEGSRRIGVVVDEIVDIVEEAVTVRSRSARPGIVGSAVVGGKVTDFIDLEDLIRRSDRDWFARGGEAAGGARVLVVEPSAFLRGLTRNYLEMAGHAVSEAAGTEEALEKLAAEPVDVLVSGLNPPEAAVLLARVGAAAAGRRPRTVGLFDGADASARSRLEAPGFDDCRPKFDREAMLESIEKLTRAVAREEPAGVEVGG